MTNTEQLKVGDRVMVLPTIGSIAGIFNPFTICVVSNIGTNNNIRLYLQDGGRGLDIDVKHIQPLPTKFDGWEKSNSKNLIKHRTHDKHRIISRRSK